MTADQAPDRRELLKNAFGAIEQLKAKVRSLESAGAEPIAIVGAACRFPGGANSLDEYWSLLDAGRNVVMEIPAARWESVGHPDAPLGWSAGLVDNIDGFDPRFFGISAREATTMDPQQRMVLEVAWEALENAGIAPDGLSGSRTGVFLGITGHDYADLLHDLGGVTDVYAATGNANNAAAGRLSFLLGLQGPSMAVDTACSSSLVSIHLACLAVRAGDCRMAIAGGVNALLAPDPFICFRNWGMMAPDGRCKTFDAGADGFVRGEGCGMIVVKRLSDAQADGDRILAVIRGSAVNQDGRSSGLTVPNGPAQEAVIRRALDVGKVDPADVGYVEAHGTGTALGDPIEANALAAVLGAGRTSENPLVVGSVKTNIGHLESAAGVAGLLKVVLSLQHERVPPHLNFTEMNPDIDWGGVPVEIPVSGREWKRGARRRIASVSSFGFSGTNAHVILEEAPGADVPAENHTSAHLFTLSARTEAACEDLALRFVRYLETSNDPLADICQTATTGRAHFSERLAIQATTRQQLRDALASKRWIRGRASAAGQRVAFLFTGQGSQWRGMGRELYDTEPVFRAAMDECARLLDGKLEHSLINVIYGSDATYASLLDETEYTQPALFALEWSLAQVWKHWGIEPSAVLGHSVGEYVALTVAGVWSLEDGISIIAERGRLMQRLGGGWGMTAVHCSRSQVETVLRDAASSVSIAAVNGADNLVLAGRLEDIGAVETRLEASGVRVKRLTVSHGFHSAQMDEVADVFARSVQRVAMNEPRVRIVSSSTGQFVATIGELRDPGYWRRQVRSAVEFASAMDTLSSAGFDTFLEIGPTPTLCSLGRECIGRDGQLWAPSVRKDQSSSTMLDSLGHLYVRGATVNWSAIDTARQRKRVALPSYPFQRQRHWVADTPRVRGRAEQNVGGHPFLGARFEIAGPLQTYGWQTDVSFDAFPYLADHVVQGGAIVPATAYLEMAVAAGHAVLGPRPMVATDAQFLKPLFLTGSTIAHVQVSFEVDSRIARIHSRLGATGGWTLHASFRVVEAERAEPESPPTDFAARSSRQMTGAEFYEFFSARGNQWGPAFQGVEHAWFGDQEGWASVVAPEQVREDLGKYYFHPAVGDAAGHVLAAISAPESGAFVGQGIDSVCIYDRPRGTRLLACARLTPTDDPKLRRGDVTVFDEEGRLVAKLFGAQLRYLEIGEEPLATDVGDWLYQVAWREAPFVDRAPEVLDWMVLASAGTNEMAATLAERMRADGATATARIDPSPESLRAALSDRSELLGIVDLRGLDLGAAALGSRQVSSGVASLLELVRSTVDSRGARLWIATRGVQPVGGEPSAEAIWQAPLWGIGRTLAVEHSEIYGGMVDLDPAGTVEECAEALWHHLRTPGGEDQVVLRGMQRFAARLEHSHAPEQSPPPVRPDGAYLITGGLGGLGLEIAHWLVGLGARHLLLIGRTALPERSTWDDLDSDHPQSAAVEAIRELESLGATVRTAAVDVADADALGASLAGGPPVAGVIHAAGVLQHQLLSDLTESELHDVLRAKLGAWSVYRAVKDSPLDFFVCFSSASALLGSPRLGAYAAANCFLDAFAYYLRGQGKRAISVNWGVWGEAGMASRFEADAVQLLADRGMGAMRTDQGFDALARIMGRTDAQIAVLPVNWQRWAQLFPAYTSSPMLSALLLQNSQQHAQAATSSEMDVVFDAPAPERPQRVLEYLARALGRILGFAADDLDVNLPISVLGLDSLMAVELKNRIASDLRVSLPTIRLLQGPSLAELAAEIEPRLLAERVASPLPTELLHRVDDLSDAEVDAALAELLKGGVVF